MIRQATILVTALILLLVDAPAGAVTLSESWVKRFEGRELTPVEGLWLWNSGALVAISSDSRGHIVLELIDSPDPLVVTPIVIGEGTFGGTPDTYNLKFYGVTKKTNTLSRRHTTSYIAKLSENTRLSLTPYSSGLKINAWRLIPYLFRFSVSRNEPPSGVEGAIRVWPPSGSPEFPIVL